MVKGSPFDYTGAPVESTVNALKNVPPLRWQNDLVTVVVQDRLTGEIRMVAHASPEAVVQTLETKKATFYSRSREKLWVKGESSGNTMNVSAVWVDCDADALVYAVEPQGPSCHTGRPSCFFRSLCVEEGEWSLRDEAVAEVTLLAHLEATLEARKTATSEASYVRSLYEGGAKKIGAKVREEADELSRALADESDERVASEAADLLFHLLVALRYRDLPLRAVLAELERRSGRSGHAEKASRRAPASTP